MLKKLITRGCLVLVIAMNLPIAVAADYDRSGSSVMDSISLLASGADHQEILERLLLANVGVEPDYLGVAFHNTETGKSLDRQEIRELMSPIRQDNAYQMIAMIVELSGHRLAYSAKQLELLLDAAFVASMRRPPAHISIEYYDVRKGQTGIGGGVSGRVPEYSVDASPQSKTPLSPDDYLPQNEDKLIAHFKRLKVAVPQRQGQVVLPLLTGARTDKELSPAMAREIAHYERRLDIRFVESIATLRDVTESGVHRKTMVAWFRGDPATMEALEVEMDGFFYR